MKPVNYKLFIPLMMALTGCQTLNPYEEKSFCSSYNDFGKCVSVTEAYESSIAGEEMPGVSINEYENTIGEDDEIEDEFNYDVNREGATHEKNEKARKLMPMKKTDQMDELEYRRQLYREMASLLQDPKTPMLRPPKIRRVLITSYDDEDVLYMPRYVYLIVDKGGWVLNEVNDLEGQPSALELFEGYEK